ncbi:MAG: hypothetical protein ACRD4S_01080 [Candidatus Acidiferrales bacterium]
MGKTSARTRIAFATVLLAAVLCGWLAWRGADWFLNGRRMPGSRPTRSAAARAPAVPEWRIEVRNWLDAATRDAASTDATAAEIDVDRAASLLTGALVYKKTAPLEFFDLTIQTLDRVQREHPENQRLDQHVTLARIELAQLRSAMNAAPGVAASETAIASPETDAAAPSNAVGPAPAADAESSAKPRDSVEVSSPRNVATNSVLNPKSLGGGYLDATLMPEDAEILEPPTSRLLSDGIRVEGLTIAGAAQTLDGIHWKDVTFVGARVRYDGGELDLQNVKFVRCIFGFSPGDHGARLATAIALGQTSLVIE